MSADELARFRKLYTMFQEFEKQQSDSTRHPLIASQSPTLAPPQQPTASPSRPLPRTPTPPQQAPDPTSRSYEELGNIEEIRRVVDGIYIAVVQMQNMLEYIKTYASFSASQIKFNLRRMMEDNMSKMNGNIERFQAIGKSVLQLAIYQPPQPTLPQTSTNLPGPSQHVPYQPASSNTYVQAPNPPQPPTLPASSSYSQPTFPPPASQSLDQYADNTNFLSFSALQELLNHQI